MGAAAAGVTELEQTRRAGREIESKSSIFFNSAHSFVIPIARTLRRFLYCNFYASKARKGFFISNTLPNYHLKEASSVFT